VAAIGAFNAGLAQLVEQRFCKPKVAGSNPASGTSVTRSLSGGQPSMMLA
jgi:threonine dehydratase